MNSPAAASSLPRILLGSLIGAVIGLILLALGLAILWKAADLRGGSRPQGVAPVAAVAPEAPLRPRTEATPTTPYPIVGPGASSAGPAEAPPRAATSAWRSIFDDADEAAASPPPAAAPPRAPSGPASRSAPRPSTPRRPPEAQRQDDSLFF